MKPNVLSYKNLNSLKPSCLCCFTTMGLHYWLMVLLFIFILSGCGRGERGVTANGSDAGYVINAVDLLNKDQYGVLAEDIDKEPVSFKVVLKTAYMNGHMDSSIPVLVENLIRTYPEVDTIVMSSVPGTYDFKATLQAGRLIRAACLRTVVPYEGYIASGGVYLFLAGCERIVEKGGRVGVHTWRSYSVNEDGEADQIITAKEYPLSDPKHQTYLDYHAEMNIPDELYWKVINTPFDAVHFLTLDEFEDYRVITDESYTWGANYRLDVDPGSRLDWSAARFYVSDGVALMHGKIGVDTANEMRSVLNQFPAVHTVEFGRVPGITISHADYAVKLGRVIRQMCLTTKIGENSYVLNEAAHAYIAGCERKFESEGDFAVASWIDSDKQMSAKYQYVQQMSNREYLMYYEELGMNALFYAYQLTIPRSNPVFLNKGQLHEFNVLNEDS